MQRGPIDGVTALEANGVVTGLTSVAYRRYDGRFDGGVTQSDVTLPKVIETLGYEVRADCFSG